MFAQKEQTAEGTTANRTGCKDAAGLGKGLRESAQRCAQEEPHTNHLSCLAQPLLSGHCELPQRGANPTQIIDIIS